MNPESVVTIPTDVSTVGPNSAVLHRGTEVVRLEGLTPNTSYQHEGVSFTTLPRPEGELVGRFATVNDVHFGETVCGVISGSDIGPTFSTPPGQTPYPEVMNRAAVLEMGAEDFDAIVVKGDLTSDGTAEQYQQFLDCYAPLGEQMYHVRGNHDSYHGANYAAWPQQEIWLPGAVIALIDTARDGLVNGRVSTEQIEWLDELASRSSLPVLVMSHHHLWNPDGDDRPNDYFGITPDDSEKLIDVIQRRDNIVGQFSGHTHRNRVRRFSATKNRPIVEVACVKDFPGSWAEYQIYEGGILQIHHRVSTPEALDWTEKTRQMYAGLYFGYAFGKITDRCFRVS